MKPASSWAQQHIKSFPDLVMVTVIADIIVRDTIKNTVQRMYTTKEHIKETSYIISKQFGIEQKFLKA